MSYTVRNLNPNAGRNKAIAWVVFGLVVIGQPGLAITVAVGSYCGRKKGWL
jgi:hypothetical protein